VNTQRIAAHSPTAARRRWKDPRWYLIYLGNLYFQPAFDPNATTVDWALAVGLTVAGVALCLVCAQRTHRRHLAATVAFTVLGVATVWFNSGASVFFVYAAAFAGSFESRTRAQRWQLGLSVVLVLLALASPVPMPWSLMVFGIPLLFIWVVGAEVMNAVEQDRDAARLRIDNARIEHLATLGERERIARDLHDLLGHTLTGVVVRAQLIRRLAGSDPDRVAREATGIEHIARDALAEVRSAVSGWRHHALDSEIEAARAALAADGVQLTVERDEDVSLSPAVEAALALALREAVTNVVRHAAAGTCTIGIIASGDDVRLTVRDDGIGTMAPEGSGLAGMRERITALGGQVDRQAERGTTVRVTVPAREAST
jgi:two-component system sensor histidine kinase DesK